MKENLVLNAKENFALTVLKLLTKLPISNVAILGVVNAQLTAPVAIIALLVKSLYVTLSKFLLLVCVLSAI
jgi:hypothetical protein